MSEHYHQIFPESLCGRAKIVLDRILGRVAVGHIDWDGPLDSPLESVTDWPEHVSIPAETNEQLDFFS